MITPCFLSANYRTPVLPVINKSKKGLSVLGAAFLIAGEMAGSGILALPRAVADSGWLGLVLVVVFCINASYGGCRLGRCWEIVEERHPEYRGSTRTPYAVIAEEAFGTFGRYLASVSVQITLFGVGTVYLLQASQIVQQLLRNIWPNVTFCIWLLIFAALIIPPMWLGSPKDFWFVGVGALLSTSVSCILIFVQIIFDGIEREGEVLHSDHGLKEFCLAFGVILYSFGGASTFPTIQNDMVHRNKFVISVCIGFMIILSMYIPVTAGAYWVYGDEVNSNVILSLKPTSIIIGANVMLACHIITAFLIVVNPVCQEVENILNISKSFSIKRCLVRSGIALLMVAIAETIPEFGKILALIGASTVNLLTFVLPNLMYIILCSQEKPGFKKRSIRWYMKAYMCVLILIGVVGGITSTYSALVTIFSSQTFAKPCYWP